ncbi:MAG TPA: hypothetical protein DCS93_20550 [Microscillaceae bacterium]|nr:hypothetical protein [Microscillaceae bacterium]
MQELFMKLIYSGVGMAALTAETFKQTIDKLVDDRKLSAEEGKKIVDEFFKNFEKAETSRNEFESQIGKVLERFAKNFGFVPATEVESLNKRIDELETKLEEQKKPTSTRRAAKKA